jgi:RNA-directed DNA polymerase
MKVTDKEIKYCQPQKGGSLQKDNSESERYAGVYDSLRITENNVANANESENRLLEKILERDNLNNAFKRVKSNKGAHGVDGMEVDELLQYFKDNGDQLEQSILDGKYHPNPVRRVEIPKDNGKKRNLGIPTAVDRVIQQAIAQVLTPIFEKQFSDSRKHGNSQTQERAIGEYPTARYFPNLLITIH